MYIYGIMYNGIILYLGIMYNGILCDLLIYWFYVFLCDWFCVIYSIYSMWFILCDSIDSMWFIDLLILCDSIVNVIPKHLGIKYTKTVGQKYQGLFYI